jgi:hypothetical protein
MTTTLDARFGYVYDTATNQIIPNPRFVHTGRSSALVLTEERGCETSD